MIDGFHGGKAPLFEPGLDELLAANVAAGRLRFTTDPVLAGSAADVLWVTYDTPVNDADESDTGYVVARMRQALPHLRAGAWCSFPRNFRSAPSRRWRASFRICTSLVRRKLCARRALDAFEKAERVVVGVRQDAPKPLLETLFAPLPHG